MNSVMARIRFSLRKWMIAGVAVPLLCSLIHAQQSEQQQREPSQDLTSSSDDTGQMSPQTRTGRQLSAMDSPTDAASLYQEALPADRIIEILQRNPDLLEEVKATAAQRLQDQGQPIPESDITDDMLYNRIEQDTNLRVVLTERLQKGGYLTEADLQSIATTSTDAQEGDNAPPSLRRGKPSKSTRSTTTESRTSELSRARKQPPEATQRPNPYPNMPALQDLYQQVPSDAASLRRFGAEIFQNGPSKTDALPMDVPAGPDYILGPGDGLTVTTWGSVSQRITRKVDREGRITLPEVGGMVVAGYTLADAQQMIQKELSSQFRDIKVDVSVTRLRTVRVYVVGDVERAGAYDISSLSTPLNALYAAGGPTARGSLRTIRHYRGEQLVREIDLYDLLLRGLRSSAERFQPGDTVLVPPVGPQVTVSGSVRRPAIYELKGKTELSEVLDLAGGVLVSAAYSHINVERIEAHQRHMMLSVNMPDTSDKGALQKALGNFTVQDGDRVTISPILPYSEKTVYLQGHVFRPGKYPFHEGLQISDVIHSYQDVLPEPSDHAEVIRLEPPDYRPRVIEFNLSELLSGEDPITLKAFDMIRVFGRYEVDPPKVSIYGEVLRPGKYPLGQKMTAAELVRLAGGFNRSAFQARADLTSYIVHKGEKVRTEHTTVDIAKAMSGDATADVFLKPGDVLTIHQIAGWGDIGASVSIKGQVMYPGTYGIEERERLSTLLKRAGGFRPDAYPQGAVLDRVQVRQMAEKSRKELIQRIELGGTGLPKSVGSATAPEQAAYFQAATQQRQHMLAVLKSQPASGRLVIKISPDIRSWENTPEDIEVRPGDVLIIPKEPNFILVTGQVYNATAISYMPGKNTAWYLRQAGGPTEMANKKDIYIIRANGSVLGKESVGSGLWSGGSIMSTVLHPGDAIVVPERIITPGTFWKTVLTTAQIMSSAAITAGVISGL